MFWTLWWGTLANRLAGFVITFLALYLVRERGFSAAEAGRVVALYGLGITVAGPLGGALADRVGRRATMLAGLVLGAASVATLALTRDPIALTALTFAAAVTGEIYRPAVHAAVADLVPPPDRRRAFGLVYWAANLGWALGLAIAGFVAERSLSALLLADAATTLTFAGIVAARVPETRPAGLVHRPALQGLARVFTDAPFVTFLLLNLLALVVFTQFQLAIPLDLAAHGLGTSTFSSLMALNGAGVVLLQPLLAPRLRRYDGARLLAASTLLFGLGFGLNAIAETLPAYALGVALWTIGEVIGFPVASSLVSELSPPSLRGRYQGAFSMTWGIAFTLSPLLGGEVLARYGGGTLWVLCLGIGVGVSLGHLAAGARRRRLAAGGPATAPET